MVVGDGNGYVGVGLGKAAEVPETIRKGIDDAKKNIVNVAIKNGTIPHSVTGVFGAGRVFLKPAAEGHWRYRWWPCSCRIGISRCS